MVREGARAESVLCFHSLFNRTNVYTLTVGQAGAVLCLGKSLPWGQMAPYTVNYGGKAGCPGVNSRGPDSRVTGGDASAELGRMIKSELWERDAGGQGLRGGVEVLEEGRGR